MTLLARSSSNAQASQPKEFVVRIIVSVIALPFPLSPLSIIMSMYPGWSPTQQFQAWYAHHLATLTFNSRPIIDKLSMAALERKREGDWEGMSVVGEVLRHGIEVVSSGMLR